MVLLSLFESGGHQDELTFCFISDLYFRTWLHVVAGRSNVPPWESECGDQRNRHQDDGHWWWTGQFTTLVHTNLHRLLIKLNKVRHLEFVITWKNKGGFPSCMLIIIYMDFVFKNHTLFLTGREFGSEREWQENSGQLLFVGRQAAASQPAQCRELWYCNLHHTQWLWSSRYAFSRITIINK